MEESIFEAEPADLINSRRGSYLVVNAIAKRVRGLQLGERALAVSPDGTRDPVKIAQQEFLEGKLEIVRNEPVAPQELEDTEPPAE